MADNRKKPALNYNALLKELQEGGPRRLYLLWGEESYLLDDFVQRLRKACVGEESAEFNARRLDGMPDVLQVEEAVNAMPFFGERTFLELHGLEINACRDERWAKVLFDIPDWCTVAITLPTESSPDGRLNLIKNIKSKGKAVEFTAQEGAVFYNWIRRRVESHGKRIGTKAMNRLVLLSGHLMNQLIPEIDKVCGYAKGDEVTVEDVEAVAHHLPEADVFRMTEDIARGDYDRAAEKLYELLAGDSEPMGIMGVIGWQMRRLYAARVCIDSGREAYYKELTGDYRAWATIPLAKKFTLRELREDVRLCAEYTIKTREQGYALSETDALKELLIRFAMERRHAEAS